MIQLNFNRFGKLVRWSLTNDKRYYVKSFLQMLVTMLLLFLFLTMITKTHQGHSGNYGPCAFAAMLMLVVTPVLGPSFMFYSMTGKHDRQALMLLPASNFEKYLMRYSTWIILFPLYIVAFFAADLLQYFIHWVLGHNYGTLVASVVVKFMNEVPQKEAEAASPHFLMDIMITALWFHSMYALGATFFRSRKFNWVLSTGVIILIVMLSVGLTKEGSVLQIDWKVSKVNYVIGTAIYIVWTLLNFWLSYRIFCRTQVIGKFVNL